MSKRPILTVGSLNMDQVVQVPRMPVLGETLLGASSLKLIEIHENIDRDFPNLIDLTELFDHPTIAELAKHLEAKLKAAPAAGGSIPA